MSVTLFLSCFVGLLRMIKAADEQTNPPESILSVLKRLKGDNRVFSISACASIFTVRVKLSFLFESAFRDFSFSRWRFPFLPLPVKWCMKRTRVARHHFYREPSNGAFSNEIIGNCSDRKKKYLKGKITSCADAKSSLVLKTSILKRAQQRRGPSADNAQMLNTHFPFVPSREGREGKENIEMLTYIQSHKFMCRGEECARGDDEKSWKEIVACEEWIFYEFQFRT